MKNHLLSLAIIVLLFSCKNSEKPSQDVPLKIETKDSKVFSGIWTRSFAMSEKVTAEVTYTFLKDSIQYEMKGPMQLNYTLIKDTIVNNRWIGDKKGETYVVFVKNKTKDKVTLLKMKSKDIESALTMPFPSDSAKSKFSSWNTYLKK